MAASIVNEAGAWAPEITSGFVVKKRKGHLAITDRSPGFVRHQLVELGYLKSAHSFDRGFCRFQRATAPEPVRFSSALHANTRWSTRRWMTASWCACCSARSNTCRDSEPCRSSASGRGFVPRLPTSSRSSDRGPRIRPCSWPPGMKDWGSRLLWPPPACWPIN